MDAYERKVKKSLEVIEQAHRQSKAPLIVNFSGGKDSLCLTTLTQTITENAKWMFCISGIDFPELPKMVQQTADKFSMEMLWATPQDHLGDFYTRLKQFKKFPTVKCTWCSRDLKFRPQKKVLNRMFGRQPFYKLNAVRRHESTRRERIYKKKRYIIPDYNTGQDFMVMPVVDWTDDDRNRYLKENNIKVETNELYERFGVSGCFYCPFYQRSIYERIMAERPELYDDVIAMENALNQPAGAGYTWLRDVRNAVQKQQDSA